MGGGGSPQPNVVTTGAPPVPVNPFGSMTNAPSGPATAGANPPAGGMKDQSGVMNAPQGGQRFFPATQSFPQAPLLTGGAGSPGLAPSDLQTALSMLMGRMSQPAAAPAPTAAPLDQSRGEHEHGVGERA